MRRWVARLIATSLLPDQQAEPAISAPPPVRAAARAFCLLVIACCLAGPAAAAEITGTVFEDRNADAMLRAGEPGLDGWVVFLDGDDDGVLDNPAGDDTCTAQAAEPCVLSAGGGAFRFTDLPAGPQQVRVVTQRGWQRTTAALQDVLLLNDAATVADVAFGQFRLGTAMGVVFADSDGDGQRDAGEPALPGWTIFADADLDGSVDAGEVRTASDADGSYTLDRLAFGTQVVRAHTRCGFRATLPPPPGRYALTIATSGLMIADRNFGAQRPVIFPGDGDGDGRLTAADLVAIARATGTTPAAGLDANGDGALDGTDLAAAATHLFDCAPYLALPLDGAPATATATAMVATATATAIGSPTATTTIDTATPTATMSPLPTTTSSPTASATAATSATSTASRTPTVSPTATAVATIAAERLAGTAVQLVNGVSAIPAVITALVGGIELGGALVTGDDIGGPAGACPLGGTATRTCAGTALDFAFTGCRVPTASGSVTLDALPPATTAAHLTNPSGFCFDNVLTGPWTATIGVQATFRDATNAPLLTATAALTGSIEPQLALGTPCKASGATMTLSGPLQTTFADGSAVRLTLASTAVAVNVATFNAQCVPVQYTMTFNGPATVTGLAPPGLARGVGDEASFDVTFDDFVVGQDARTAPSATTLAGGLDAACAGGALTLETLVPLLQTTGAPCPHAGTLRLVGSGAPAQVFYLAGERVGIDADADGTSERELDSCRDPALLCDGVSAATATPTATRTVTRTPSPSHTVASATPTATGAATPTATGSPTATVLLPTSSATPTRSLTATPSPSASPSPSRTPTSASEMFCATLPTAAAIPDANPTGLTSTITVASPLTLNDLDVRVTIAHSWVGDLRITLRHVESGRTAMLLDRPGEQIGGCGLDDIDATFDDASRRSADLRCAAGPPLVPAIDGSVDPTTSLDTFIGDALAGTWQLTVTDHANLDTGSLVGWCLVPNSRAPVVADATCDDGTHECVQVVDEPFSMKLRYVDPDADAVSWHIRGVRLGDGWEFTVGQGNVPHPVGTDFDIEFQPLLCPTNDCPDTTFDLFFTVRDAAGRESPAQRVRLIVTLFEL